MADGPDCSGKSTAAKHLMAQAEELGLATAYIHNVKSDDVWRDHLWCLHEMERISQNPRSFLVVDRWWPSESAYGRAYRGGSKMPLAARGLDRVALHLGVTYVKCLPPLEVCVDAHRELRPHRLDELDGVRRVWGYYRDWGSSLLPSDTLDYLDHCSSREGDRRDLISYDRTAPDALEELTWRIFHDSEAAPHVPYPHVCLPMNQHSRIIVGEVANPRKMPLDGAYWPFVDDDHCSEYLHEAMTLAGLYEADFTWANARDPGSEDFLNQVGKHRGDSVVLALGHVARHAAEAAGFDKIKPLPHPSWARRWGQVPVRAYADLLREAVA